MEGLKEMEVYLPIKVLEIADGYVAVFDRKFAPAAPEAKILELDDGRRAYLAFGPFWIPLDVFDFKNFSSGFNLYMAGSPETELKAPVRHVYELSADQVGKLSALQEAMTGEIRKMIDENGGKMAEQIKIKDKNLDFFP